MAGELQYCVSSIGEDLENIVLTYGAKDLEAPRCQVQGLLKLR